jgi:hypothetical protein
MDKVLARHPVVDVETGLATPEWLSWFEQSSANQGEQLSSVVRQVITSIVNVTTGGNPTVTWASIDKTGSSLADLSVRNASDLQGSLSWAQMPQDDGRFAGRVTLENPYFAGQWVLPEQPNYTNLGSPTQKFLSVNARQLVVDTLVAQSKIATIGGTILVAPTSPLRRFIALTDTTMIVEHNSFGVGEILHLEARGVEEWIEVVAGPTGSGPFVYEINRAIDGIGPYAWQEGDAVVSTGVVGGGFIDVYSQFGIATGIGPTMVGNVRTGVLATNFAPRWAIGNLNGVYGYVTETFGAAFGDPVGAWVKIDATNGVRIGHNVTTHLQLDPAGNASFASGSVTIDGTGIYVEPGTGGVYSVPNSYRFNQFGTDAFGMSASDTGTQRYLFVQAPPPAGAHTHGGVFVGLGLASALFQTTPLGTSIELFSAGSITLQGTSTRVYTALSVYDVGFGVDRFTVSSNGNVLTHGTIRERNRATPMGEWSPYTVTLGTMTVGDGSVSGRYTRIGTTVHFQIIIILGATSSISAAAFTVSLPTTFGAGAAVHAPIHGVALDSSTSQFYDLSGQAASTSTLYIRQIQPAGVAYLTSTVPFTWAANDQIYLWGTYEEV